MSHYSVPPVNRRNARKMRKVMTDAELQLWNELRAHRLMGLSFRRQMPIAGYIVDFACPDKKTYCRGGWFAACRHSRRQVAR